MTVKRQPVCGQVAPENLTQGLRMKCQKQVDRHGSHTGDHKTTRTQPNVGKVTVWWKQRETRQFNQPPVIELPGEVSPDLARLRGVRCACPDEKQGNQHVYPCSLGRNS